MNKIYHEPARAIPVTHDVDVAIAGGGPSGTAAAVCAARMGLSTIMIEQTAIPGGMLTHVTQWLNDFDNKGGFPREFLDALKADGACEWPYYNPYRALPVLDDRVAAAGVRHLYLARAVDVMRDGDGAVGGIIVESKSGRHAARARVVIDATGDGDVAAAAGAAFEVGRPSDGACQAISLPHLVMNYVGEPMTQEEFLREVEAAAGRAGRAYRLPYDRARLRRLTGAERAFVNGTPHVCGFDALDAAGLSDALVALRAQAREYFDLLSRHSPGFKGIEFGPFPGLPGVRESRRMVCDEQVTREDAESGRPREDGLFRVAQSIDIHKCREGDPDIYVQKIQPYHLPLGALFPKGLDRLMVVGRCIGGTHEALASYRIIADCMAMGEAAAITARYAIEDGVSPRSVDARRVAKEMGVRGYAE